MVERWTRHQSLQDGVDVAVVGTIDQPSGKDADAVVFDLVRA